MNYTPKGCAVSRTPFSSFNHGWLGEVFISFVNIFETFSKIGESLLKNLQFYDTLDLYYYNEHKGIEHNPAVTLGEKHE